MNPDISQSGKGIKVILGVSGGVDSAVAALLLKQQGYEVEALHMTNWDEADSYCTAAADYQDARKACEHIGIPLHRVNFAKQYQERVFTDFLSEYRAGRTPNPDVLCNRYIKFGEFYKYAQRLGGDFIATGHYARVVHGPNESRLLKGLDQNKDQSYFLHAIHQKPLQQTLFPLGELPKTEVRNIANRAGLPNFAKRDSTGICFIGERPFREFLSRYIDDAPGNIETETGLIIGRHQGLMHHTLGQRQGLQIGGVKGYPDEPWYVAGKDIERNVLLAVQGRKNPLLWSTAFTTEKLHWISRIKPEVTNFNIKTRYRQDDAAAQLEFSDNGTAKACFAQPQWSVTPGQYAVFYEGDICLGGGVIESATTQSSNN
ncbi:MAG: tRNA 2-thiouridine(34) synthase MnmA [Gammaproteobacteria bacterium]|nr:tRNA 2-thiouridine(34) synthase MnmA [Gammaproteobacteria bacterium]